MSQYATRLLVLGVVRLTQPVHGYDVRREVLSWRANDWANVSPGSIYNALKTLHRDRLIAVSGTDRDGARPERTTYRLTDEGEKEFFGLVRENLWRSSMPNHPLLVGLSFFPLLTRDEVASACRNRVNQLEADIAYNQAHLREIVESHGDPARGGKPHHVAESQRLIISLLEAEAAWARDLADRLERGELDHLWSETSGMATGFGTDGSSGAADG